MSSADTVSLSRVSISVAGIVMGVSGGSWSRSAWASAFGWGLIFLASFFVIWVSLTPTVLTILLLSIVIFYAGRLLGNKGVWPTFWGALLGSAIGLMLFSSEVTVDSLGFGLNDVEVRAEVGGGRLT